jgi:hypothetical protein
VAKDVIKILGDWTAWASFVRQARLVRPDGEAAWVLIRCRTDATLSEDGWKSLKTHGRLMARIDHPSVLRLLHTTKVEGQPAWVYEGFQAVSLARALDVANAGKDFFPARVAVEAAERVAQGLLAGISQGANLPGAPGPVIHLGPAPAEILVDSVGGVRLAGFSIDAPDAIGAEVPDGYAPHKPGTPEQRASYGLGALMVHVLGGEHPAPAASEAGRQEAVIRRAVIRVLARPGEAVPESLPELIRSCLAHEPDERPPLTEIQDQLAAAAKTLRSAGLRTWSPANVPGLLQQAEAGYPDPDAARMQRHIEPVEDASSGSFVPPPVHEPLPREIPTILAPSPLSPEMLMAMQEEAGEHTPLITSSSLDSMPTSETDVHSVRSTSFGGKPIEPIPVEIGAAQDTWDAEGSAQMGGWPLVAGALIGMVVAALVAFIAVDRMVGISVPSTAVPAPSATDVDLLPDASDALVEPTGSDPVGAEADAGVEEFAEPEGPVNPPVSPSPAVESNTAPDATKPAKTPAKAPTKTTPAAAPAASSTESAPAPASDEFEVTFEAAPNSVDRMVVRCHKGGVGEGANLVRIVRAGKGPCKVEGYRGEEKLSVSAVLKGPKSYTCFSGGARICE